MTDYQITVFASEQTLAEKRKLYERIVSLPSHVDFDYPLITKAMQVLYGTSVIIQITIKTR